MDTPPTPSPLLALPAELIQHILSFLPLYDLLTVSLVCHGLKEHSREDTLWQLFVQEQVPGRNVPKPRNLSWREVFQQHHPYWFLAKNKIWFADTAHTGKLIVARYDHRINAIEAYALVAERKRPVMQIWEWNPEAIIHTFQPKVQLDMVSPVIRLNGNSYDRVYGDRLQHEIHLDVHQEVLDASAGIRSRLLLARPWPKDIITKATPVWPPLVLPSTERTRNDTSPSGFRHTASKPARLHELSTNSFRIRRWMEFASRANGVTMRVGEDITTFATLPESSYTPTPQKPWQGIWVGDYAGHGCEFLLVTQPDEPHPLPERAEWAMRAREREGSVSSAGSWSTAPAEADTSSSSDEEETFETASDAELEDSVATLQGADIRADYDMVDAEEAPTDDEDSIYRGRIEAVKLTGDPNIPRGEYTFIAPDIGPDGLVRVATEDMFKGARIVKSVGHIAAHGFRDDTYMTSQLILVSHDRLAQYWETFGHVSFYQRVDLDQFVGV
ncbi:F-box domain-containing protein [Didymella exigua CBS 183.55]|uniref:F-box domain-containing protein n=1 Tax=Didymella exigua CBS 183.55 TaxID=1150837 RepID=A0A6A5R843_9PLEO|nr:F-box domain-containing protein [Didymella exigua CBS 183.55]KAF1923348.1 F-box domain-containing protein [Didymella exigua CBS 183.55]